MSIENLGRIILPTGLEKHPHPSNEGRKVSHESHRSEKNDRKSIN